MCNCISDIDAKLGANGHMLNATMLATPPRAMVSLIRKDKWKIETRHGKPKEMLASFCPWCGEKYPALAERVAL